MAERARSVTWRFRTVSYNKIGQTNRRMACSHPGCTATIVLKFDKTSSKTIIIGGTIPEHHSHDVQQAQQQPQPQPQSQPQLEAHQEQEAEVEAEAEEAEAQPHTEAESQRRKKPPLTNLTMLWRQQSIQEQVAPRFDEGFFKKRSKVTIPLVKNYFSDAANIDVASISDEVS